jgi:hypothetical protein
MIETFEDFCLYVYVLVDDFWKVVEKQFKHPRQKPLCSDSELLSMVLISEAKGWDVETEALSQWQSHRDLFPCIPSQSRFNRRRRQLADALLLLRRQLLSNLDVAQDPYCAIDSLPIPVVAFHHAPRSSKTWREHQAQIGYVSAKKQYIFGYRLQVLLTLRGVILDFVLVPAAYKDSQAVMDLLEQHWGLCVLADKGFVSQPVKLALWQQFRVLLLALTRKNQKKNPLPEPLRKLIPHWREICETVNSQLVEQFHIQRNYARSFWGLCARLHAKLTAHTLSVYLNRLFGEVEFLHIKKLAFPN